MNIEIKGVHFDNKGAHLMLLAVLQRLQRWRPDVGVVLGRGPGVPEDRRAEIGALRRLRLRRRDLDLSALSYQWPAAVHRALGRRGLVAEGGLDAILDASGFAYGRDWDPWLMAYAAAEMRRLAAHGKPYVFLPQAFGPFEDTPAVRQFAAALERSPLVCVRDDESAAHLATLQPTLAARVERFPDFTIGLAGDAAAAESHRVDRATVLLVPNHHMLGARNADSAWREGYVGFLVGLAQRLQARCPVALLNHEGQADAALCQQVAQAGGQLPVIADRDPLAIKGVIGAAGAVVSSRYHACVSALSQGVPCLGTAWSHKYRALYDEFGVPDDLQRQCNAAEAAHRVLQMLDERAARAALLARRTQVLQDQVEAMWRRVFAIMQNYPAVTSRA